MLPDPVYTDLHPLGVLCVSTYHGHEAGLFYQKTDFSSSFYKSGPQHCFLPNVYLFCPQGMNKEASGSLLGCDLVEHV